jgi:hypothetical protein
MLNKEAAFPQSARGSFGLNSNERFAQKSGIGRIGTQCRGGSRALPVVLTK